jgi:hypothetical protein
MTFDYSSLFKFERKILELKNKWLKFICIFRDKISASRRNSTKELGKPH